MIISENNKPTIEDFRNLMQNTDKFLNDEASKNQDYFLNVQEPNLRQMFLKLCRSAQLIRHLKTLFH